MLGQFILVSEAMSTCEKARAEATSVASSDRLSSLPPEMKGDILSHLSAEEAVRTSTLSSTWRDAWTDMPKTFLDDGNFARTKFVTLVDMVLLLHRGIIEEFYISGNKNYHDEFGRWLLMLSRRSPRSIIIELNSGSTYRIPSCLFSINNMESLQLENCIISLPRVFQGFKSLTYLSLNIFSSTDMVIQNLISFCPVLTDLRLIRFEGIRCLNIQAPKLEYLVVSGDFEDINLDAPDLEWAIFSLDNIAKAYQSAPIAHDKESYVKQSLGSLSDIKTLGIVGIFMEYLSKGCILMKLPIVFTRLEDIHLMICFWDQRQVLNACSLFQKAPNLKNLELWVRMPPINLLPPSITQFMFVVFASPNELSKKKKKQSYPSSTWDQDQASIQDLTLQMQMDHLVTASVECFRGLDYEVDFVAKLLSWAPALEELKIGWKGEKECHMVAKLIALPRVSPRAKVIVTLSRIGRST